MNRVPLEVSGNGPSPRVDLRVDVDDAPESLELELESPIRVARDYRHGAKGPCAERVRWRWCDAQPRSRVAMLVVTTIVALFVAIGPILLAGNALEKLVGVVAAAVVAMASWVVFSSEVGRALNVSELELGPSGLRHSVGPVFRRNLDIDYANLHAVRLLEPDGQHHPIELETAERVQRLVDVFDAESARYLAQRIADAAELPLEAPASSSVRMRVEHATEERELASEMAVGEATNLS